MRLQRLPLASNVEKTLHWHDLAKFYVTLKVRRGVSDIYHLNQPKNYTQRRFLYREFACILELDNYFCLRLFGETLVDRPTRKPLDSK